MKYGFSFKGIHTSEFAGLTVKTASRPIKPDMRDAVFTAPFMDGSMSTASNNPYGREFYEARQFSVTMFLTAVNLTSLNKKLAKISAWLTGSGELIFDDTPLIVWEARAAGAVDYAPERAGKKAVLSVSFEVQPFGSLVWSAANGPEIGQETIRLGDNLPIGMGGGNYKATIVETPSATHVAGMVFTNYGDRPVRPVITMKSVSSGASARIGTVTVSVNDSDENKMTLYSGRNVKLVVADCNKHTLTDGDGMSIMGGGSELVNISGRFIELPPGSNRLRFSRLGIEGAGDVEVTIDFIPLYMWDIDLDETDWG